MNKNEALSNLKWFGWLFIVMGILISLLGLISGIVYWDETKSTFKVVINILFWLGISICGWFILSSRKAFL